MLLLFMLYLSVFIFVVLFFFFFFFFFFVSFFLVSYLSFLLSLSFFQLILFPFSILGPSAHSFLRYLSPARERED